MLYPVDNLDDAYNACYPDKPLEADDERYLDLQNVRNKKSVTTLARRITRTSKTDTFCKQLVTGHTGCGKSTELKRLQKKLTDASYFVVFFDVEVTLDLNQITYQDVLLNIAQAVIESMSAIDCKLNKERLSDLYLLLAEKTITTEQTKDVKTESHVTAQAGLDIFSLAKLFTKLTAEIRSGSSRREQIRQTIKNEQLKFIAKLNELLTESRAKLNNQGYSDLIIIVDGLEKIRESAVYNELFIEHAEQLNDIHCHIFYTIPIALAFNANLGDFFANDIFFMPMVKYQSDDGKQYLVNLINKRIKSDLLFEDEALLHRLIAMSGGSVRDLLRLIRTASETEDNKIQAIDVDRAINNLVKEFDRLVKEEDVPFLRQISIDKRVIKDEEKRYERLLSLRLINEYENGKTWADLHPALKQITWLQEKLNQSAAI